MAPRSTYIRRPPYWEGGLAGARTLRGLRPLAVLGDNITTDHLSPSNAILPNSAAGEYLARMGVPQEDFNSYATHRGDHLTAQRATFANPMLLNELVRDADGKVRQGSLTRLEPDGTVMRMWEAIEIYMQRSQPLIIIAGADYGQDPPVTGRPRACVWLAWRRLWPKGSSVSTAPMSLAWACYR